MLFVIDNSRVRLISCIMTSGPCDEVELEVEIERRETQVKRKRKGRDKDNYKNRKR